jgi:uncharacterized surface protein with fasciclin (FAS1) repeats
MRNRLYTHHRAEIAHKPNPVTASVRMHAHHTGNARGSAMRVQQRSRTTGLTMKIALPVAAFALLAAACSGETPPPASTPAPAAETMTPAPAPAAAEAKDIVDTAVGAGQFSTLVAAVQAAGLESTLRGPGPFTVFAPTDAAFAALPAGTVDDLLKPENKDKLTAILTYHVLPAEVMSSAIGTQSMDAATVQGKPLKVDGSMAGKVMINDATVVSADVDASNGVIHVIDKVLMPPM